VPAFVAGGAPKENGVVVLVFVVAFVDVPPKVNPTGLGGSAPRVGLSSIRSEGGTGSGVLVFGGSGFPNVNG